VKASAPGFLTTTATASLKDGGDTSVALRLVPDPAAQAAPPAPAASATAVVAAPTAAPASSAPPPPPASGGGGGNGAAIASFIVGGVGVAVGSVLGIMALGTKSTLDSNCVDKACPPSQQSNINSLGSQATVSTIGFGVGIVGVTVGVILLAVSHGGGTSTGSAAPPSPQISPWIGLGSAGVGGTFQ
jgi:hypothetical protein